MTDEFSGDPLAGNRYDLLSLAIQTSFERSFTVLFGPNVLFYKVTEGPGTYFWYAQKIVLALNQAYGETVDAEDVLALERICVVPAQHVLVAQEIREDGKQGVSHRRVVDLAYPAQQQPQPQQLALGKHLPIAPVAPSMEAVGLVSPRNFVIGDWQPRFLQELLPSLLIPVQVVRVRAFEEPSRVGRFARLAVVLHSPHPVGGRMARTF